MLSSLSSTIITVFGILPPSEGPGGQPRRGGLACVDSSLRGERKLVPIR
jgi:hypothetical protein